MKNKIQLISMSFSTEPKQTIFSLLTYYYSSELFDIISVIGVGFGLLAITIISRFDETKDISGRLISGVISIIILPFTLLSGQLIVNFLYLTARGNLDGIRQQILNSSIADKIVFVVSDIVAAVLFI